MYVVNRGGNVASQEGSVYWLNKAAKLCQDFGFKKVRFRGGSAYSLTEEFDWDALIRKAKILNLAINFLSQ